MYCITVKQQIRFKFRLQLILQQFPYPAYACRSLGFQPALKMKSECSHKNHTGLFKTQSPPTLSGVITLMLLILQKHLFYWISHNNFIIHCQDLISNFDSSILETTQNKKYELWMLLQEPFSFFIWILNVLPPLLLHHDLLSS